MENPKMAKKVAGFFAKKGNKALASHEYREAAGKEKDTPAIAKREMKALKGAPAAMKNYEKKEHKSMGMACGGMTKRYAKGGAVKKMAMGGTPIPGGPVKSFTAPGGMAPGYGGGDSFTQTPPIKGVASPARAAGSGGMQDSMGGGMASRPMMTNPMATRPNPVGRVGVGMMAKGGAVKKYAKGGKTAFDVEFEKARAKGAGTKFTFGGKEIAAYRAGEEPESWHKGKSKAKSEAAPSKPAPSKAPAPRPTTQADTNRNIANAALESARMAARQQEKAARKREDAAMTPEQKFQRTLGENVADYGSLRQKSGASSSGPDYAGYPASKPKVDMEAAKRFSQLASQGGPMADYYAQQAKKFAGEGMNKGGAVRKYAKGGVVRGGGCATKGVGKGKFI